MGPYQVTVQVNGSTELIENEVNLNSGPIVHLRTKEGQRFTSHFSEN